MAVLGLRTISDFRLSNFPVSSSRGLARLGGADKLLAARMLRAIFLCVVAGSSWRHCDHVELPATTLGKTLLEQRRPWWSC